MLFTASFRRVVSGLSQKAMERAQGLSNPLPWAGGCHHRVWLTTMAKPTLPARREDLNHRVIHGIAQIAQVEHGKPVSHRRSGNRRPVGRP